MDKFRSKIYFYVKKLALLVEERMKEDAEIFDEKFEKLFNELRRACIDRILNDKEFSRELGLRDFLGRLRIDLKSISNFEVSRLKEEDKYILTYLIFYLERFMTKPTVHINGFNSYYEAIRYILEV